MQPDFKKYSDGLMPAIVQDITTGRVLMLGFMNEDAFNETRKQKKVTFYSRSKKRLWMKGEESGNVLHLHEMLIDCDNDTLLIKASPAGPVCHTGADTCFGEKNADIEFITSLEDVIQQRKKAPADSSYTAQLFSKGLNKIAQKVGEEAVEVVIEAKDNNTELFLNESADLFFHYLILLQAKGHSLRDVIEVLKARRK